MRVSLVFALLLVGCAGPEPGMPTGASFSLTRVTAPSTTAGKTMPKETGPVPGATPHESTPAHGIGAGSGASSGGGGSVPSNAVFWVQNTADLPVASATVMLEDGRTAVSDATGQAAFTSAFSSGLVTVSAPGYATSLVSGLPDGATLHLRAAAAIPQNFTPVPRTLHGQVSWPSGDHVGGEAYYQDDLDSLAASAPVASDGSFSITVTPSQPGTPEGVVLVAAGNSLDQTLLGVSGVVSASTTALPAIAMALADRPVQYNVTNTPAGLDHLSSQLEILVPGAPPMTITGYPNSAGGFQVPDPGSLPGSLRVIVEAQNDGDTLDSTLSMPVSNGAASGTFLALPSVTFEASTHQLTWSSVPGATGYDAAAGPVNDAVPGWEAWTNSVAPFTLPTADWLAAGLGQITVEAIDDAALDARQVASVSRQLRIDPWTEQSAYRVSRRRLLL